MLSENESGESRDRINPEALKIQGMSRTIEFQANPTYYEKMYVLITDFPLESFITLQPSRSGIIQTISEVPSKRLIHES